MNEIHVYPEALGSNSTNTIFCQVSERHSGIPITFFMNHGNDYPDHGMSKVYRFIHTLVARTGIQVKRIDFMKF